MITLNRKVRFSHVDYSYSGTDYTEYLFGSIGLRVNANIQVVVSWEAAEVDLVFDNATGTITRTDNGSFLDDGFRDGDGIVITGTASNNGSTAPGVITVTEDVIYLAGVVNETVTATIQGATTVTSMDFYPNLIENNSDFSLFNLTDRETVPRYVADEISEDSGSPTVMQVATNSRGWVSAADSATIYKDSSSTPTEQIFIISHTFDILPIFRANELVQLQNGLPPAGTSFKDRFCLKYVYTIDAKFSAYDPTIVHTTDENVVFSNGQTGWFDEFINGRKTTWTKEALSYTDNATGGGLSSIQYCGITDVEARVQGIGNMAETRYMVHVMYLPLNEERYINTLTDWKTNFIYERAFARRDGPTVQGENTGDYHFLKDVTAYSIDGLTGSRTRITFKIDFSQVLRDEIDCFDLENRNYLIFITCQNNPSNITGINQTALKMDVNTYACNKDDAELFQIIDEVQFFNYPKFNGIGYSDFILLPRDTVLTKTQFHIKMSYELELITMLNISFNIIAVKENGIDEIILETFTINTSNFTPNCENIQEIYFNQDRDFILPEGDPRKDIKLFRIPQLDIGTGRSGLVAYELIYPFKVRWEEWRRLDTNNRCFPTPTQNWMIYDNESGWSIKVSIKAEVEKNILGSCSKQNPYTTQFEHIVWGEIKDPCEIPYSVQIDTYEVAGIESYEGVIANDVDTYVEAVFTGDFNGIEASQLTGTLSLDAWGVGGVAYVQEIGDRLDVDEDFVWYGASSTLKATLTKVNNSTVTLSAFLNYLLLPTDTRQFILSASIKYYQQDSSSPDADCLDELFNDLFRCGELVITEVIDGDSFLVSGWVTTRELRNVYIDSMKLTFVSSTSWLIGVSGTIDGRDILDGAIAGGNIIKAPIHPYTNDNVGDTIEGDVSGVVSSGVDNCGFLTPAYLLDEDGDILLDEDGSILINE